ncbi:hypothetical protein Dimus_016385 [Dionaea muscipula]
MATKEETKERAFAAFRAMKNLGIPEEKTKFVLKKLLKVYEKNWVLIEAENYRVLADGIFDADDDPQAAGTMIASENMGVLNRLKPREALEEEAEPEDEPECPLKRSRLKNQDGLPIPNAGETSSKKSKLEHVGGPEARSQQVQHTTQPPSSNVGSERAASHPVSPALPVRNKGKQPVSPQIAPSANKIIAGRTPGALQIKEPRVEQVVTSTDKQKIPYVNSLIKPKDEPFVDEMAPFEVPLAVVHPDSMHEGRPLNTDGSVQRQYGESRSSKPANKVDDRVGVAASTGEKQRNRMAPNAPMKSPTTFEIAASSDGEVKLSLSCNSVLQQPNFCAPSLDKVMKYVQDKCRRSYQIIDSSFSVEKLMRDFCESFLELGSNSSDVCRESGFNLTPVGEVLMKSASLHATSPCDHRGTGYTAYSALDGSVNGEYSDNVAATHVPNPSSPLHSPENCRHPNNLPIDIGCGDVELRSSMNTDINSIVVVPEHQLNPDDIRCLHDVNDVARGEEKVKIPLLHDSNSELLPSFHYIPQNVVFQDADVNISLAQIGEEDCCPTCSGDCLPLATPCACTCRNGGDFVYTSDGVIKDDCLEECLAIIRNPQRQHLLHCKDCPLKRLNSEDILEPCKGHLGRKFIKECWSKCGCSKHCANRVVQRGITRKLQVFLTPEGKGWGLRTLEDLLKGAFVCEFVGEILTIVELRKRISWKISDRHSYAVLLDADWGSGVIRDEQALCLDATSYGNIARFINHRCSDANLVHIPVEVDTTNHLYYRVAFFTTREVNALEELTWDYGVDFDDPDQYLKPFICLCGSSLCRYMKHSKQM